MQLSSRLTFVKNYRGTQDRRLPCSLYRADVVPYEKAWQWQKNLVNARRHESGLSDALLLMEHQPIYTLGHGAQQEFLKFVPSAQTPPVLRTERGGEVTYHCPGQLVGYPILDLRRHRPDLHWYLRQLEEVLIKTLAVFDISGQRMAGLTGVWVEGYKVAAIGIKVSRWITMHGFALNICPDLSGFDHIVPCGIANKPVGSLVQFCQNLTRDDVQTTLEQQFSNVFHCSMISRDLSELD